MPTFSFDTLRRLARRHLYLPVPVVNALVLLGCVALLMALQAHDAPSVVSVDPEPAPQLQLAQAH